MISHKYKITNKQGKIVYLNDHTTDPNNVYALQKYPAISKAVKNNEFDRTGQNNFWDFYSYYGKQTLGFSGLVVAENHQKLEQMKRDLILVFALPIQPNETNDGYVTIEWTDDDNIQKKVEAKIVSDIQFDRPLQRRYALDFIIQLKTKDNFIVAGGNPATFTGKRGYQSANSLLLPATLPITWGSIYVNILNITVNGVTALPKIKLVGERQQVINNPVIKNLTTGETMKINTSFANAQEWLEIDTEAGKVVNHLGVDISALVDTNSAFITLANGVNQLIYLSNEDPVITELYPEEKYYDYTATINTLVNKSILPVGDDFLVYGATKSDDRFGNKKSAYKFNGLADAVNLNTQISVDTSQYDYTVMCWVKAQVNPNNSNPWSANYQSVLMDIDGNNQNWAAFGISIRQSEIIAWLGGWGSQASFPATNLYDGNWHHIAYVQPKSTSGVANTKFYVDGLPVTANIPNSGRPTPYSLTTNMGIGHTYLGYNSALLGEVDLPIIENRAWTDAEILAEYTAQKDGVVIPRLSVSYKELYAN